MLGAGLEAAMGCYQAGEREAAVDVLFAELIPDWREAVEAASPGGLATADWATFFEVEFPAMGRWQFGPAEAAVVACPVLSWLADPANPIAGAGRAFLLDVFDRCEIADLPDATHLAPLDEPGAVASAVDAFVVRHSAPAALT